MNKKKVSVFQIVVGVLLSGLVIFNIYEFFNKPRLAYVRSQDIIEGYAGTKEARSEFQKKKGSMTANVDSLKLDFDRAKNQYLEIYSKLSAQQRAERENFLGQQQNQLIRYSEAIDQKIEEEDTKMMQEVLSQINSFIEKYAQQNHYDIIMGTTLSGSLLYGEKSLDITDKLVEELNKNYKGK